jgi:hypothetical protein
LKNAQRLFLEISSSSHLNLIERWALGLGQDVTAGYRSGKDIIFLCLSTILGRDLITFGYIKFRAVILPIMPLSIDFRLLNVEELRMIGAAKTADSVEKRRTQKSVEPIPQ